MLSRIRMITLDKKNKSLFVLISECVTISAAVDTALFSILTYRITGYTNKCGGEGTVGNLNAQGLLVSSSRQFSKLKV